MSDQKFTEEEVRQIIQRAVEIQSNQLQTLTAESSGLTIRELEEIGKETGISMEAIHKAVLELSEPVISSSSSSDTNVYEKRIVDISINETAWQELVSELRHRFGSKFGKIEEDLKRMEWTHMSLAGIETKVTLNNRGDQTEIKLSQRVGLASRPTEAAMYGFFLTFIVSSMLAASSFNIQGLELLGISALIFVFFSSVTYLLDSLWRKKKHSQLKELGDVLVDIVSNSKKVDEKKRQKFMIDVHEKSSTGEKMKNMLDEIEYKEETTERNTASSKSRSKTD